MLRLHGQHNLQRNGISQAGMMPICPDTVDYKGCVREVALSISQGSSLSSHGRALHHSQQALNRGGCADDMLSSRNGEELS